jgi:hypothetical protein
VQARGRRPFPGVWQARGARQRRPQRAARDERRVQVAGGQRDDPVLVRRIRQRRQSLGVDDALGQRDGLPGVVALVMMPVGVRVGGERAGAGAGDQYSLAGKLRDGSGDRQRADLMSLDEPAG